MARPRKVKKELSGSPTVDIDRLVGTAESGQTVDMSALSESARDKIVIMAEEKKRENVDRENPQEMIDRMDGFHPLTVEEGDKSEIVVPPEEAKRQSALKRGRRYYRTRTSGKMSKWYGFRDIRIKHGLEIREFFGDVNDIDHAIEEIRKQLACYLTWYHETAHSISAYMGKFGPKLREDGVEYGWKAVDFVEAANGNKKVRVPRKAIELMMRMERLLTVLRYQITVAVNEGVQIHGNTEHNVNGMNVDFSPQVTDLGDLTPGYLKNVSKVFGKKSDTEEIADIMKKPNKTIADVLKLTYQMFQMDVEYQFEGTVKRFVRHEVARDRKFVSGWLRASPDGQIKLPRKYIEKLLISYGFSLAGITKFIKDKCFTHASYVIFKLEDF